MSPEVTPEDTPLGVVDPSPEEALFPLLLLPDLIFAKGSCSSPLANKRSENFPLGISCNSIFHGQERGVSTHSQALTKVCLFVSPDSAEDNVSCLVFFLSRGGLPSFIPIQ